MSAGVATAWLAGALAALLVAGCGKDTKMTVASGEDAAALGAAVDALSRKRVYFAHQSVGGNILEGVEAVLRERAGNAIRIVQTSDPAVLDGPVLAHSLVGGNGSPRGKIDEFRALVDGGVGDRADIALVKLCFVDIGPGTDVTSLFEHYRRTMAGLRARHPATVFVHVTVPLTSLQTGPKAWVKRLLGRPLRGLEDNARREEYNELLRREYGGREPVFDLARIEATLPGRGLVSVAVNGTTVPALAPEYTDDGGHLNESGRAHVARGLLLFLGGLR